MLATEVRGNAKTAGMLVFDWRFSGFRVITLYSKASVIFNANYIKCANKLGKIAGGPKNVLWTGGAPQIIPDVSKVPEGWIKYNGDF